MGFQVNRILFSMLVATLLAACGGGGAGGSDTAQVSAAPPVAAAPAAPKLVKIGPITGFGSVFVDGQRFETSPTDTDVLKGDEVSDESELSVGMIVRVRSSSQNDDGEWIAERIEFDEDVKGPIDAINGNVLVVLGQTVQVIDDTIIDDGLVLGDLAVGDILEVSGYRTVDDEIEASYLERKLPADVGDYEVLGQIRELDTVNEQFKIGGLTVNYGLAELDDLDAGLANGLLVEVEDDNKAYMAGDLVLDATKVEGEDRFEFEDEDDSEMDDDDSDSGEDDSDSGEDEFEIEGVITEILSSTVFMLGEIQVTHDSTTEFSDGTADDLMLGTRVEVKGDLSGSNMVAHEIEFKSKEAEISGLLNSVDADNDQLTVMGILVQLADGAELQDSLNGVDPFTLSDLVEGDFVEVEGTEVDNVLLAGKLERKESEDESELKGMVDAFDGTAKTVTLFDELITTDDQTEYKVDDSSISAEDFFARLNAGQSVVEAEWDGAVADTLLPVTELSLKD